MPAQEQRTPLAPPADPPTPPPPKPGHTPDDEMEVSLQPFVWQPAKPKPKKADKRKSDTQGYRTIHLHFRFLYSLHLHDLLQSQYWGMYTALAIYRRRDTQIDILQDFSQGQAQPVSSFFRTHNIFQEKWTHAKATEFITNKTMLNVRPKIVLKEKHKNPIRKWSDAHWVYDYTVPTLTACLVTCLATIPYNETVFSLRNTIQAKWIELSLGLAKRWPQPYTNPLTRLELSPADRMNLLGHYPPENIPDIDVPWQLSIPIESSTSWSDDEQLRSSHRRQIDESEPTHSRDI